MVNEITAGPDPLVIVGIVAGFLLVCILLLVLYAATRKPTAVVPMYTPTYPENPVLPEEYRKNRP
jgi:hypothetical protein